MWWQQSLWKIPPNFDGLRYWMQQEAAHAAIALQGALVADVVLPSLNLFGPLVYLTEVAIGVSLLLGLLSRLGALLGVLMGLNLWLGLYSAPGEWPWTYMFLSSSRHCSSSTRPGASSVRTCGWGEQPAGPDGGAWVCPGLPRHHALLRAGSAWQDAGAVRASAVP